MEHQQEYTLEPIEYSMPLHPHGGAAPPPGGPGPQRSQRNGPGHATGWQPGQELLPPGGVSQYPAPPHVMMYHPQPWPANQEGGAANQPQHTEALQRFGTEAEAILHTPYGYGTGGQPGEMLPPAVPMSYKMSTHGPPSVVAPKVVHPPPAPLPSKGSHRNAPPGAQLRHHHHQQQDYNDRDDQENQKKGSNVEVAPKGRRGSAGSGYTNVEKSPSVKPAAAVAGWGKETKRVPTLGQMAAQVQAHAQAKMRAAGLTEMEDVKAILGDQTGPVHVCPAGSEHTGRWTRSEHERFLAGLKRYGKEWKRVASSVRTRTVVQTRTHAQKYFQKLQKQMAMGINLEDALEMCMDDSDVDSDDGGPKSGGRVARKKSTNSRAAQNKIAAPPALHIPPPPPPTRKRSSSGRVYTEEEMPPQLRPVQGMEGMVPELDMADSSFYGADEDEEAIYGIVEGQEGGVGVKAEVEEEVNEEEEQALMDDAAETMHHMHGGQLLPPAFPLSIMVPEELAEQDQSSPWQRQPPQPSPAASGKRKYAELAAAEILCAAATQDIESMDAFKCLRAIPGASSGASSGDDGEASANRPPKVMCLKNRKELHITNPDTLEQLHNPHLAAAGAQTPWDTEVRALSVFGSADYFPAETTPLRTDMWQKLYDYVSQGDVENTKALLDQARQQVELSEAASTHAPSAGGSAAAGVNEKAVSPMDLAVVDDAGKSFLMIAAGFDPDVLDASKSADLCVALIEFYPSIVNIRDRICCTALHWAAKAGNSQVIKLLVSRGCPLNAQNLSGETALHWASRGVKVEAIKELIGSGASTHLRNNESRSALDLAAAGYADEAMLSASSSPQGSPQHVVPRSTEEEAMGREQREKVRRIIFEAEPRMRTLVVYHHECVDSPASSGKKDDWETGQRVQTIMSRLKDTASFPHCMLDITSTFERASVEAVSRVHSGEYVQYVHELSQEAAQHGGAPVPFHPFVPKPSVTNSPTSANNSTVQDPKEVQMYMCPGTLSAARRSAGAVITAVDHVMSGRNRNAFCVVRPPGHHIGVNGMKQAPTTTTKGCGLSVFNNVAIGALHALDRCERVAIIDIDAHHGDGTEDVVRNYPQNNRLLFFSIHLHDKAVPSSPQDGITAIPTDKSVPAVKEGGGVGGSGGMDFYPGTGEKDDVAHNIYNVPMIPLWKAQGDHLWGANRNTYTGRTGFRWVITERLIPALRSFNPKLIILSTGFDGLDSDVGNAKNVTPPGGSQPMPVSGLDLTVEDYGWVTRKLQEVADMCCHGRMISVLEGGFGCQAPGESDGALDLTAVGSAAAAHVSAMIDPYPFKDDELTKEASGMEQADSGSNGQ